MKIGIFNKFFDGSHVNEISRSLVLMAFFVFSGVGLMSPFFSVFVTEQIKGGSLEIAGFASSVFSIAYALFLIPVGYILDKKRGEYDDFVVLFLGATLASVVPFLYYFYASEPVHLFIFESLSGIGFSMAYISWETIFSRHATKKDIAFNWSVYEFFVAIGSALAAALGGFVAQNFGFPSLFLLTGFTMQFGVLSLLLIARKFKLRA
jgi:MFS family permease